MRWNCLSLQLPIEGCAQWKVPLFKWTVKWQTKRLRQRKRHRIVHEIVHVTEFFEKKTECSTKPKLFNSHVFASAQVGNNPICLLLYTVRYFQVLYPWLFCLRKLRYLNDKAVNTGTLTLNKAWLEYFLQEKLSRK